MCPADAKRPKCFRAFTPSEPSPGYFHVLMAELSAPRGHHAHFTTSKTGSLFKKGHY